jgi:hypothetical protein
VHIGLTPNFAGIGWRLSTTISAPTMVGDKTLGRRITVTDAACSTAPARRCKDALDRDLAGGCGGPLQQPGGAAR